MVRDMGERMTFMQKAIALAYVGMEAGHGGPFGAVIVREGKVIGQGHNRVVSARDPAAHAEMVAIRDACSSLAISIFQVRRFT